MSKTYDKVSWHFIWRVLNEFQFPESLTNIIMHVVTNVEANVKWNKARSNYFRPQRGIHQGNPISPYMFVLCMEKLFHLIMEVVNAKYWEALRMGKEGPWFADDLLLIGEAKEK